jgi:hypothetical protein
MSEQEIEKELQSRGLDAPRLSPERIDSVIVSEEFHTFHGKHMICCLTLLNGFTVTGESAVVSPENFREDIGKKLARQKARDKVWGMEAYLLRQKVAEGKTHGE